MSDSIVESRLSALPVPRTDLVNNEVDLVALHKMVQPRRRRFVVNAIGPRGSPFTETGQVGRVLLALKQASEAGVTPLSGETWALRLSDHIRKLKNRRHLAIVTMWEKHDHGRHARYVLQSHVTILKITAD